MEDAVTAGLEHAINSIPAQQGRPDAPAFSAMVVDDHPLVREAMVARLRAMGATEVVEASPVVVADGVRRVLDGGVYADPSVASLLAAGLRGSPTDTGVSELSGREVEVIRLVADGQSNKQIGDALGLSALTVKSHLARIARKLGTGDRAEMVALAMRAGVIR